MKILAALFLTACTPWVTSTPTNPSPRPMITRGSVEMFTAALPTRPYIDVSNLVAGDGTTVASAEELKQSLADRAETMGCDGLVLGKIVGTNAGPTRATGTCIVYTDAPPVTQSLARR